MQLGVSLSETPTCFMWAICSESHLFAGGILQARTTGQSPYCPAKLSEPIPYHECMRTSAGHLLTSFSFQANVQGQGRINNVAK